MTYLPHQITTSDKVYAVLKKYGVCLLAGEMRTGKSRTAIRVAEMSKAQRILIVTKKRAIEGFQSELKATSAVKDYTIVNYEAAHKLTDSYDLIVVDESHAIGRAGKPTQRFKTIKQLCRGKPVLLLSGTPSVETTLALYYQFALSDWSPFKHCKNFYEFFRRYGEPSQIRLHGRLIEQYKKGKPEILATLKPLIVPLTQAEAGIKHTAIDKVHTVKLLPSTTALIEQMRQDKVVTIAGIEYGLDSDIKERVTVHQVETGAVLLDDKIVELPNTEVVDYIRKTFGDHSKLALMAHFRSTRHKLEKHFKNAKVFSSVAHAEGVDLSDYTLVIVNTEYSGAKHVQRRDRVVNLNRTSAAEVHHIVCEGGISPAVYAAVSLKRDFNLAMYRELKCSNKTYKRKS